MTCRILVPRLVDERNLNPQSLNAKALLSRWSDSICVDAVHYSPPLSTIECKEQINLHKLWVWRFWRLSLWLRYQNELDAIFYPSADIAEVLGIGFRDAVRREIPVIATCEGLVGAEEEEKTYSKAAGHPVFCQRSNLKWGSKRNDWLFRRANHIIAISPFLAGLMRSRYGDKVSVIPLGVDTKTFYPSCNDGQKDAVVVSAGRVAWHKRPQLFVELARRHRVVKFRWFGEGEARQTLLGQVETLGLDNLEFPGSVSPMQLAGEFRKASVFVLPSKAEGVPKVTQEAAACGLPVILFGFYESPSVVHERNGFVVWSDEEFFDRTAQLIENAGLCYSMGNEGAEMGSKLDWDLVAPLWERKILEVIDESLVEQ